MQPGPGRRVPSTAEIRLAVSRRGRCNLTRFLLGLVQMGGIHVGGDSRVRTMSASVGSCGLATSCRAGVDRRCGSVGCFPVPDGRDSDFYPFVMKRETSGDPRRGRRHLLQLSGVTRRSANRAGDRCGRRRILETRFPAFPTGRPVIRRNAWRCGFKASLHLVDEG